MKNDTQLALFSKPKPAKKSRTFWDLPSAQRPLVSVRKNILEQLGEMRDAEARRLDAFLIATNLLRGLRDRTDADELISELYWCCEGVLSEQLFAESVGSTVEQLRERVEPTICTTICMDCQREIDVDVHSHEEADQTRRGRIALRCAKCFERHDRFHRELHPGESARQVPRGELIKMRPVVGRVQ